MTAGLITYTFAYDGVVMPQKRKENPPPLNEFFLPFLPIKQANFFAFGMNLKLR